MNTPTKVAETTSPVQETEKSSENNKSKDGAEEKKIEVTNPAPKAVK